MAWVLNMHLLHAQVATTPTPPAIAGAERGRGRGGSGAAAEPDSAVAEVLENTLWNRQLGVMSEEIVAALVCQIFEGAPSLCMHIILVCGKQQGSMSQIIA